MLLHAFSRLGLSLLCASLLSSMALADDDNASKRLYRYYNDKGIPTLSYQITDEHIRYGYEIIDTNMQVVKKVPPIAEYQKGKEKRDSTLKKQQQDAHILRLFASTRDAESARDRQISTLETSIAYNTIQLQRIKRLRANFVSEAAAAERKTKKALPQVKSRIEEFDKQIADLQTLINAQRAEKEKINKDFAPIIARLIEIEKEDAESSKPPTSANIQN